MSQGDAIRAAQQFLGRMDSGAEPAEIAQLFTADPFAVSRAARRS
jgi:hypothetical protein